MSGLRQRRGASDPTLPLLLSLKPPTPGRDDDEGDEEDDAGRRQQQQQHRRPSCSYPSSFLSTSSTTVTQAAPAPAQLAPSILALSAAGASADRTAKQIMSQLEKSVQQARRAFTPKRPYLADMKDPLHHFRTPDLVTCVLRATLQVGWWV
jgi:hypothetical protein